PREYALMPFGGAGPLHACALAEELGIARVLCPRTSGVLCALGLAGAAPRRGVSRTGMLSGDGLSEDAVARTREELLTEAGSAPARARDGTCERTIYELRYHGQSYELSVESSSVDPDDLREAFARAHERRYGYRDNGGEVELVTIRASAWGATPELNLRGAGGEGSASDNDDRIEGPAVYPLPEATLYVPQGWSGRVDEWGTVRLERNGRRG